MNSKLYELQNELQDLGYESQTNAYGDTLYIRNEDSDARIRITLENEDFSLIISRADPNYPVSTTVGSAKFEDLDKTIQYIESFESYCENTAYSNKSYSPIQSESYQQFLETQNELRENGLDAKNFNEEKGSFNITLEDKTGYIQATSLDNGNYEARFIRSDAEYPVSRNLKTDTFEDLNSLINAAHQYDNYCQNTVYAESGYKMGPDRTETNYQNYIEIKNELESEGFKVDKFNLKDSSFNITHEDIKDSIRIHLPTGFDNPENCHIQAFRHFEDKDTNYRVGREDISIQGIKDYAESFKNYCETTSPSLDDFKYEAKSEKLSALEIALKEDAKEEKLENDQKMFLDKLDLGPSL